MSLAIETTDLRYSVGKSFDLVDVNLHVPSGAVYGFLGPNGAGKTTMVRLLLGMLKPASGRISVLGGSMPASHAKVLARVGYVPERPHVYPTHTVAEAIRLHSAFYPTWDSAW